MGEEEPVCTSYRTQSPAPRMHTEADNRFSMEQPYMHSARLQPAPGYTQYTAVRPMHNHSKTGQEAVYPRTEESRAPPVFFSNSQQKNVVTTVALPSRSPAESIGPVMPKKKEMSAFEAKLLEIGVNPEKAKTFASRAKIRQYPASGI